jgi:hypothetical protein
METEVDTAAETATTAILNSTSLHEMKDAASAAVSKVTQLQKAEFKHRDSLITT